MKKLFLFIAVISLSLITGCAGFKEYDENGKLISRTEANGFLRTITVKSTYYQGEDGKRGTLKEKVVSTDSTTKDVLLGLDKFIDSTVNTAAKLKP